MPRKSNGGKDSENEDQNQWVMIMKDNVLRNCDDKQQPTFRTLRHPKSEEAAMFLFTECGSTVHEVLKFDEDHRSWFIGQHVQQDGGIYLPTPVDPLYLLLPFLQNAAKDGKFIPLEQMVVDEDVSGCNQLCDCLQHAKLEVVADVRGDDDLKALRYNQEKTLKWLKKKVEKVADKLEEKETDISSGATAAIYQQSSKASSSSREDYIRYAHGIVSDYLPLTLSQELRDSMGIKAPVREKPEIEEPPAKKARKGSLEPTEDYTQGNKPTKNTPAAKLSSAQSKLSKVDKSGMKSLSSFFSAKPKPKPKAK